VVLADGSKVWLNAASSLRYPTAFPGSERVVELTGEGYFEISADASKPFRVQVNGTEVEVLGTQFNVMAYPDEGGMRTTLVEGKVRISSAGGERTMAPGQQAVLKPNGNLSLEAHADIEEAIAWQKGQFLFRDATIEEVCRQLARWYDLEVEYEDKIAHHFNAPIPRNMPLTKALALLEGPNRVQFRLEGKKLFVYR
jgi:ferric-dicitrate binding protein FerR (iron transport regulator)